MLHHNIPKFIISMLLPLMILIMGFFIGDWAFLLQKDQFKVEEIIYNLKDKKVLRTIDTLSELNKEGSEFRNHPIDRPGMVFKLKIPDNTWQKFKESRGFSKVNPVKTKWKDVRISINNLPERSALIRVHGWSSAQVDRKSFYIDLLSFQKVTKRIRLRKFFLLNMYADPYSFKMKFCNQLLSKIGLFPSYNQFVVLNINNHPQGLYLMVERSEDAIRRVFLNVSSVFRIKFDNMMEPKYIKPDYDSWNLINKFQQAISIVDHQEQAALIENIIDVKLYMQWVAFNSLVQNGDTIDELFIYESKSTNQKNGKLKFAAWDYDELQTNPMHAETDCRDPLIWSASLSDEMIIQNSILYSQYRIILKTLLDQFLTEKYLEKELKDVLNVVNSINTGLPAEIQKNNRIVRDIEASKFKKRMFNRRLFLIKELQ